MRKEVVVVLFMCFLMVSNAALGSQENKEKYRLIFSTFDVSSAGNYTYLRDGIQSMLISRLAAKDKIEVLDRAVGEKELDRLKNAKGKKEEEKQPPIADYLVEGALYNLKSGLNVQVILYPLAAEKDILRYSIITNTPDTLIADVEQLSGEIVQGVTGRKTSLPAARQQSQEATESKGFVTVHPEAAYKKGQYTGTISGTPGGSVQATAVGNKRSVTLSTEMTGMAVYDTDGDGIGELFVVSGSRLELYRLNGKSLDKVASTGLPKDMKVHAVNAADLDNDGKPEIYLSATAGLDVSSMIVKWSKEEGFVILAQNIPWYLRPVNIPGKGWRLLGQKRGTDRSAFVRDGIYLLNVNKGHVLKEDGMLPLPSKVNLFDFIYADLDGDGKAETVAIDQKGKMKVFNQANELLWVSDRNFGGSKMYLGPSYGEAVNEQDRKNLTVKEDWDRELVFVPGRMIVADVDSDGRQEIIVNENTLPSTGIISSSIVGFFSRLKTYKEGTIVGLAWNGEAMKESWRTGKFKGYIADHGFAMLSKKTGGAGQGVTSGNQKSFGRLYVGDIPNSGSFASLLPGSDDTELTVYDLEFSTEKTK